MKYNILIVLFLLAVMSASADDGAIGSMGGTVALVKEHKSPLMAIKTKLARINSGQSHGYKSGTITLMKEHPSIRMVRETVNAKIIKVKYGYMADVYCRFVFHNEGKATTVKMGFPCEHDGKPYENFRSLVDGKLIPTKYFGEIGNDGSDTEEYMDWYVKDVPFAAGQTRIVEDKYTCQLGGFMNGIYSQFDYILRTGRSWKGSIGDAVIMVDASEVTNSVRILPNGYSPQYIKHGKAVTWHIRDFEPENDISLSLMRRDCMPEHPIVIYNFLEELDGLGHTMSVRSLNQYFDFWGGSYNKRTMQWDDPYSWDSRTHSFTLDSKHHRLRLVAGSRIAVFDGKRYTLPTAPFVKNGELHVPVVAVAKILGMKVTRFRKGETDGDYLNGCYWIDASSWTKDY